jgi:hypothetical protein
VGAGNDEATSVARPEFIYQQSTSISFIKTLLKTYLWALFRQCLRLMEGRAKILGYSLKAILINRLRAILWRVSKTCQVPIPTRRLLELFLFLFF